MPVFKYSPIFLVLSLALLFAGNSTASTTDPNSLSIHYRNQYIEIKKLLDDLTSDYQKFLLAKLMIDSFISANPDFLPIYIEQARATIVIGATGHNNGRKGFQDALNIIKQVQKKDPNYVRAYVLAGHVYTHLGRYNLAKSSLDKAELLSSKDPWYFNNRADLLLAQGQPDDALKHAKKALMTAVGNEKATYNAIWTIFHIWENYGIRDSFHVNKYVFENFRTPKQRMKIARRLLLHSSRGSYAQDKAFAIINVQRRSTPDNPYVKLEHANFKLTIGKTGNYDNAERYQKKNAEEAKAILESIQNSPGIAERKFEMLFNIALNDGDLKKARILLNDIKSHKVDRTLLATKQAQYYYHNGNYKKVIDTYKTLSNLDPSRETDLLLMQAYKKNGDLQILTNYHNRIVKKFPNSGWVLSHHAKFLLEYSNNIDEAIKYGVNGLKRWPSSYSGNVTALALLIKAANLHNAGMYKEANKFYNMANTIKYSSHFIQKNCMKYCEIIEIMLKSGHINTKKPS